MQIIKYTPYLSGLEFQSNVYKSSLIEWRDLNVKYQYLIFQILNNSEKEINFVLPDYRWDFPKPASHFVRDAEPAK
jgi:hypothetical protein